MASTEEHVQFILSHLDDAGAIVAKKMFGEYGIYADGKFFGMVCDNQFFIKPTEGGRKFIGEPTEAPPYPGAKNSFLIAESELTQKRWINELVRTTVKELPTPKPKKKKKK